MSELVESLMEQARHISSLRCGLGTHGALDDLRRRLDAVEQLESELFASQAREAELREKLAEQHAWILEIAKQARMVIPTAGQFDKLVSAIERIDATELRKLLESKVPEGWQLVPNTMTEEMGGAFQDAWFKCIGTEKGFALRSKLAYEAALAAAPQPKEPKE